jgi:solute carrier family 25 phosphate transporter 3
LALTPLDVVKTNIQTNPKKYTNPITTLNLLLEENGIKALFAGWAPTFFGYALVGGLSYSLTDFFRR